MIADDDKASGESVGLGGDGELGEGCQGLAEGNRYGVPIGTKKRKIVCQKIVLAILVLCLMLLVFHKVYIRPYLKEREAARTVALDSLLETMKKIGKQHAANIKMIDAMPGISRDEKSKLRLVATEFAFDSLKKLECEYFEYKQKYE